MCILLGILGNIVLVIFIFTKKEDIFVLKDTWIVTTESPLSILKDAYESVSCVFPPVSKNCSKGALENYLLTQTFLLCQRRHLSRHSQSRVNPHFAEASTLFSSYGQYVQRQQNPHQKENTHAVEVTLYSVHFLFTSFIHVFPANGVTPSRRRCQQLH